MSQSRSGVIFPHFFSGACPHPSQFTSSLAIDPLFSHLRHPSLLSSRSFVAQFEWFFLFNGPIPFATSKHVHAILIINSIPWRCPLSPFAHAVLLTPPRSVFFHVMQTPPSRRYKEGKSLPPLYARFPFYYTGLTPFFCPEQATAIIRDHLRHGNQHYVPSLLCCKEGKFLLVCSSPRTLGPFPFPWPPPHTPTRRGCYSPLAPAKSYSSFSSCRNSFPHDPLLPFLPSPTPAALNALPPKARLLFLSCTCKSSDVLSSFFFLCESFS